MTVAVIGLGVIGTHHLNVLKNLGMDVCAVCDIDESKFSSYQLIPHFTDYREMMDTVKPDSVHICTPHYLHAQMIIDALSRNINVLCEKPLCIKSEDIDRILAAEAASKAILGVCHQNRYNPGNLYVKQLVEADPDKAAFVGSGSVVWSRGRDYYNSGEWRGKWATEGGGVLINQALHTLDLLLWILGEPDSVTAMTSNFSLKDVIEVEDTACAMFSGGANFSFFATNASHASMSVELTLKKRGTEIKVMPKWTAINGRLVSFDEIQKYDTKACYGSGHEGLMREFYDCVQNGRHFHIDGHEAAKVIRLILAIYKSNGNKINIEG